MNSFLDMAIPGLRCLNPGCQAEAPMGNRITFRQILYDGWTCSYCGWEYEGALSGKDESIFEVAAQARSHLPSRDEMEQDQVEQPKSIYDMNRAELVAILNRFDILLGGIPVSGKALSNDDIRSYIVNHVPTQYGPQQTDKEHRTE